MGARRKSAVAMNATATNESGYVSRERQARPLPQRLDQVIHDRTRLAILAALAASETLSFIDLKATTGTTDGNLSVHARRLEEAGYVLCEKRFVGRTPRTEYRLSAAGRKAFEKYLDHMDALIKATRRKAT
jgi:DNA-binding transcriptional ArsR family regulator